MLKNLKIPLVIFCSILSLLVIAYITYNLHKRGENEVISKFKDNHLLLSQHISKTIHHYLERRTRGLNTLSTLPSIQYYEADEIESDINEYFGYLNKLYIKNLLITDGKGQVIYSLSQYFIGNDYAKSTFWTWAQETENKEKVYVSYWDEQLDKVASYSQEKMRPFQMFLVKPLYQDFTDNEHRRPSGKFIGIIILTVDMEKLIKEKTLDIGFKMDYETWIIDSDGTLIFQSHHPEMQFRNIKQIEHYDCHISFEHISHIILEKEGFINYELNSKLKKLATFYPMEFKNTRWVIVVTSSYKAITAISNKAFNKTLLFIALIMLIFSLSSFVIYRNYKEILAARVKAQHWQEKARLSQAIKESEQKFRAIFDNSVDGILLSDLESKKIYTGNQMMCKMLGYSLEEIKNLGVMDVHPEEDLPYLIDLFEKQARRKISLARDLPVKRKDASIFYADINSSPVTFTGRTYLLSTFRDITERKGAEEALRESEEKYRGVVEESLIGVYIIQDGVFKFINKRFCDIFGYKYNEIVGKLGPLDFTYLDDRATVQKNIEDRLKGFIKTIEYEIKVIKKNGEIFPVKVLGTLASYKGKPAIIGTLLDLSKENALELQLMRSQKMESLGQLAAGIAHDFNNILGIITGSLDIVQSNAINEKSEKMVKMAINAAERGSEIVKRLLIFARADDTELIPVSLPLIIDETIKILEHTFEKNIIIKKSIEEFSAVTLGNKEQLIQMLLNVCVNARDAMMSGGILSIHLEKTNKRDLEKRFPEVKEENYCAFYITDTGIGMDDWTKEHIFDPFFTTKERGKGTGLGLSIVHGIVSRHKGFIDVKSSPGQATTFSIYLPITPMSIKADARHQREEEIKGGNEKILIVEDEEYLREILKESLISLGYEVLEAGDGFEAIEIYKEKAQFINLIILDIGLPRMTGDQVFLKLKEINPRLNVLIASGYLELARKKELEELGVKEIINKPYSLNKVASAIRKILDDPQKEPVETSRMA